MFCFGRKSGQYSINSYKKEPEPPVWQFTKYTTSTSFNSISFYLNHDGQQKEMQPKGKYVPETRQIPIPYGYCRYEKTGRYVWEDADFWIKWKNLLRECKHPDASSMSLLILGVMLYDGTVDIESNLKKGLHYLQRSAETGFPPAMYAYAMRLKDNNPLKVFYLERATMNGYFEGDEYLELAFLPDTTKLDYSSDDSKKSFIPNIPFGEIADPLKDMYKRFAEKEKNSFIVNKKKVSKYTALISEWELTRSKAFSHFKKIHDEERALVQEMVEARKLAKETSDKELLGRKKKTEEQKKRDDPDGSKERARTKNEMKFNRDCWINAYA